MGEQISDAIRLACVLPALRKRAGWRTHAVGLINAMGNAVIPYLFVAEEDAGEAQNLFPGMPIYPLPTTQFAWFSSKRGFLQLVDCYYHIRTTRFPEVDLVHSFEAYPTGLVGHWLTQRLGTQRVGTLRLDSYGYRIPHVITCHGTYGIAASERFPDRLFYKGVLRNAQAFCPVSDGTARQVNRYFKAELAKTMVIPILNGNDYIKRVADLAAQRPATPYLPDGMKSDFLSDSSREQPILLSVGDVKPRKGQDISLAAFVGVKASFPDAQYWIVGDPHTGSDFQRQLEEFIQQNNLKDVKFLGHVSDRELQQCYQQASIFVLTPRQVGMHFEGFGLVYLEAGAYGLPVVATRTGGVAEAVLDGQTGLLADEDDVDSVTEAILRLLQDPDLAKQMGLANRKWAQTLTWERAAGEQLKVYRAILEQVKKNLNN